MLNCRSSTAGGTSTRRRGSPRLLSAGQFGQRRYPTASLYTTLLQYDPHSLGPRENDLPAVTAGVFRFLRHCCERPRHEATVQASSLSPLCPSKRTCLGTVVMSAPCQTDILDPLNRVASVDDLICSHHHCCRYCQPRVIPKSFC